MENISEEIIFDYLEGNLHPQEKEAFELRLNESELLENEVRLWRQSYLIEDALPDTRKLEARLLLPGASGIYFARGAARFLMLVLMVFLSTDSFDLAIHTSGRFPLKPLREIPQDVTIAPLSEIPPVTPYHSTVRITRPDHAQPISRPRVVISGEVSTRAFNPQWLEVKPVSNTIPEWRVTPTDISTTFVQKQSSFKKKMPTRRRPLFQKGRVPYVVPLKSNNF